MANITNDPQPDDPANGQPNESPGEIIPATDTTTITPNQDTATMEVHAHDLHKAPGHGWKHYIFEFLMLFLAVFCGFLAENFREQRAEHLRANEYMASLYQDLKTDTINLGILLKVKKQDIANNDSLFEIFKSKQYLQETNSAYFFGRKVVTLRPFYPTNGTITQLENSGNLRLIQSRAIVDSIQSYKLATSYLNGVQDFEREHFMVARGLMGKIFDANVFDIMMGDGNSPLQRSDKNYPLMPFTAADLNDFHIPMNFIKRNKMTQVVLIAGLQKKAADLMQLLREKYTVEQE